MHRYGRLTIGVALMLVVVACDGDGGDDPGLERIDGPAQVDEERLEEQTPDGGTVRGG